MGHKNPFETDKIPRYWDAYIRLAAELGPRAHVCEVGVGPTGGSQLMWQGLFPLGEVWGVDHNSPPAVWPAGSHQVVMDQTDPALPQVLSGPDGAPFDLIVEDASHQGALTLRTFNLLWPLVRPGGYYVVEDWQCDVWEGNWGKAWHQGLFEAVQHMLTLLDRQDSVADAIEYRWGLCIIHKRSV